MFHVEHFVRSRALAHYVPPYWSLPGSRPFLGLSPLRAAKSMGASPLIRPAERSNQQSLALPFRLRSNLVSGAPLCISWGDYQESKYREPVFLPYRRTPTLQQLENVPRGTLERFVSMKVLVYARLAGIRRTNCVGEADCRIPLHRRSLERDSQDVSLRSSVVRPSTTHRCICPSDHSAPESRQERIKEDNRWNKSDKRTAESEDGGGHK